MEKMRCEHKRSNHVTVSHSFDVQDDKGRKLGVTVTTYDLSVVANESSYYFSVPGQYFGFTSHATRDGEDFGTYHSARTFATAAERNARVAKYLKDAKARAVYTAARLAARASIRRDISALRAKS